MNSRFVIFDNKGETHDRYTIVDTMDGDIFGCSEDPFSPVGFAQYSHTESNVVRYLGNARRDAKWLGVEVKQEDLPEDVVKYINQLTD